MYIGYLAGTDNDFPNEIDLTDYVRITMKFARRHSSAQKNMPFVLNGALCKAGCGDIATEAHHIKPIWALALESLAELHPQSLADLPGSVERMWTKSFDFSSWHHPANLLPLCDLCHLSEQAATDKAWRLWFARRYPVVFHRTWADALIRGQFRKYRDVSFAEYAKMYLKKQIQELGG